MDVFHGKLMWRSPWASNGIALGLLDGWRPWMSSMASSCGGHHGHQMELHWDSWMGGGHGCPPWQLHVEVTMGIKWNCIGTPGWADAMDVFHGKLMWRSPWASNGIALGLLDGRMPWISSMASSGGDHHGHPWELHWDSWMGGCHGYLPWQAQVEITMGIPGNCIGTPGWVDAMDIFHGKLKWRSPWASHGIALGLLDGWMPWISSMASSSGDHHGHPMELHWDSWMGGCHGSLPWQAQVEVTMGIPWNCIGILGWVDAMEIFHGKLMWRSPWASHGIALGSPGWVDAMDIFHGKLMWR